MGRVSDLWPRCNDLPPCPACGTPLAACDSDDAVELVCVACTTFSPVGDGGDGPQPPEVGPPDRPNLPDVLELLVEHRPLVLHIARRARVPGFEVDDVMQEVALEVVRKADKFGHVSGSFGKYLGGVAKHVVCNLRHYTRREMRNPDRQTDGLNLDWIGTTDHDTPAALAEREEQRERLREALLELPPGQREAVRVSFFDGVTLHRHARSTGYTHQELYRQRLRGMKRLRERLAVA